MILNQISELNNLIKLIVSLVTEEYICVGIYYDGSVQIFSPLKLEKKFFEAIIKYIQLSEPFHPDFEYREELQEIMKASKATYIFVCHYKLEEWKTLIAAHSDVENTEEYLIKILNQILSEI